MNRNLERARAPHDAIAVEHERIDDAAVARVVEVLDEQHALAAALDHERIGEERAGRRIVEPAHLERRALEQRARAAGGEADVPLIDGEERVAHPAREARAERGEQGRAVRRPAAHARLDSPARPAARSRRAARR